MSAVLKSCKSQPPVVLRMQLLLKTTSESISKLNEISFICLELKVSSLSLMLDCLSWWNCFQKSSSLWKEEDCRSRRIFRERATGPKATSKASFKCVLDNERIICVTPQRAHLERNSTHLTEAQALQQKVARSFLGNKPFPFHESTAASPLYWWST
jgi:hypothetical protein